jgi:hypothetical protein
LNLEKSINNLTQRIDRISPETSNEAKNNDGVIHWRGKKIIPLDQWFQIKKDYNLRVALQFFPDDYPTCGLPSVSDHIPDARLKEDSDKWYSEYKNLMEFRRNPTYGHEKCFHCLLSPAREQSKLFIGIDKIIAKALERRYNISSTPTSSIYPCRVLNIFECPYATDNTNKEKAEAEGDEKLSAFDTSDLFDLSEIAFHLELALTKAQIMTKSNDLIYEVDFETGKFRHLGYFGDLYDPFEDEPLEEKFKVEVKRLSKVPIRGSDDIYHALTDRETLDKLLEQGLDEEHQKDKDYIIKFLMSIKDSVQDLFEAPNTNNSQKPLPQYTRCSICQGFANIRCINCNDIWLCIDHWKPHRANKHSLNDYSKQAP